MNRPNYTPAQLRAFDWLPSDGAWRANPSGVHHALNSLERCTTGLMEIRHYQCGPRGGWVHHWSLTPEGVAEKRRLTAEGKGTK
jgi:hypothetical protein